MKSFKEFYIETYEGMFNIHEGRWDLPLINKHAKYDVRVAHGLMIEKEHVLPAIQKLPDFPWNIEKGTKEEDTNFGIDYWITRKNRPNALRQSVQLKLRVAEEGQDVKDQMVLEMIKPWLRTADSYNQSKLTGKDAKEPNLYFFVDSLGLLTIYDGAGIRFITKTLIDEFIRTRGNQSETSFGSIVIIPDKQSNKKLQGQNVEKLLVYLKLNHRLFKQYQIPNGGPYQLSNID